MSLIRDEDPAGLVAGIVLVVTLALFWVLQHVR